MMAYYSPFKKKRNPVLSDHIDETSHIALTKTDQAQRDKYCTTRLYGESQMVTLREAERRMDKAGSWESMGTKFRFCPVHKF